MSPSVKKERGGKGGGGSYKMGSTRQTFVKGKGKSSVLAGEGKGKKMGTKKGSDLGEKRGGGAFCLEGGGGEVARGDSGSPLEGGGGGGEAYGEGKKEKGKGSLRETAIRKGERRKGVNPPWKKEKEKKGDGYVYRVFERGVISLLTRKKSEGKGFY